MYEYNAKVLKVIDGDTLEVEFDLGFKISFIDKIRLLGINTPEIYGKNKDLGIKSKNRTSELVPIGSNIIIRTHKDQREKYGRYLAHVVLPDGRILNDILLSEGLAISYMNGN
jgi:micrococcal nuclease